jgi:hypothetical protein
MRIEPVEQAQAAPVQRIYDAIERQTGRVSPFFKMLGNKPSCCGPLTSCIRGRVGRGRAGGQAQGAGLPAGVDPQRLRLLNVDACRFGQAARPFRRADRGPQGAGWRRAGGAVRPAGAGGTALCHPAHRPPGCRGASRPGRAWRAPVGRGGVGAGGGDRHRQLDQPVQRRAADAARLTAPGRSSGGESPPADAQGVGGGRHGSAGSDGPWHRHALDRGR